MNIIENRLIRVLALLALLSTFFVSVTAARYTSTVTGTVTATVAACGLNVATPSIERYNASNTQITDGSVPCEYAIVTIPVTNTGEVGMTYQVMVTGLATSLTGEVSFDGVNYQSFTITDGTAIIEGASPLGIAGSGSESTTLYLKLQSTTALSDAGNISITATGTQVAPATP